MIAVIQRVTHASVATEDCVEAQIGKGLLVLLGIQREDTKEDTHWLVPKIVNLRIFNDKAGVMNVSVKDDGGDILVVSQFTLCAGTKKGNRPSYINAMRSEDAIPFYLDFVKNLQTVMGKPIYTGKFGADMKVSLLNDGPTTILIDTKDKR